jgi:GNAT superfamily N-acetyltransferase
MLQWVAPPAAPPLPDDLTARTLSTTDGKALGSLFWQGFQDEDAYASPAEARTEADDTLAGVWGPVTWDASMVTLSDGNPVAATVVVADHAHNGLPLLAYAVTLPDFRRRGIGAALILAGVHALHAQGVRELHLAVLPDNPALSLYVAMGFIEVAPVGKEPSR